MRREQSTTNLSSSSSSSSTTFTGYVRFCYKKLNLVAFAGTLVYIGYLVGCMEKRGDDLPLRKFVNLVTNDDDSGSSNSADVTKAKHNKGSLRAFATSADNDVAASWDTRLKLGKNNNNNGADKQQQSSKSEEDSKEELKHQLEDTLAAIVEEKSAQYNIKSAVAKGPVIHEDKGKVTTINLIGERHSGTNWITDHLVDCFGDQIEVQTNFTRFKHWFQFDDPTVRNDSALVIAMFRDPYDWIEAMRERPHHAHEHIGMQWKDFVTKPWVGPRGPEDQIKIQKAKEEDFHIEKWGCLAGYKFDDVIPCSAQDSVNNDGYSNYMYELRNDESHRAFSSIVELRSEKIRNFVQVPNFHGVKAFFPQRYEALNMRGTSDFLKQLEEVSGLKAKCEPFPARQGGIRHKIVDPEYTEWMNKYHDWDAEAMIGYVKRDPIPRKEQPVEELGGEQIEFQMLLANSTRQANAQIK